MHQRSIRVVVVLAVVLVTALAGADRASAAGAVSISTCQTLSDANTTYKLTTDLTSCGDCLVVAADRITIDLQGQSITSTCAGGQSGAAITDLGTPFDVITVKNGSVSRFRLGVDLARSTRVSVLGVTATDNEIFGIRIGAQGLVKSSEVSGSVQGIQVGDRGQVQQCNVHGNVGGIRALGDNCLITMNTANANAEGIRIDDNKCTVSYNTANDNDGGRGITTGGRGHLVTQNVALNNRRGGVVCFGVGSCLVALNDVDVDYEINCPSTVTNNDSTNGFPTSYILNGNGCKTVGNE